MNTQDTTSTPSCLKDKTMAMERRERVLPKKWNINDADLEEEFFRAFERGEKFQKEKTEIKLRNEIEHKFNRATTLSETLFNKIRTEFEADVTKLIINYSEMPCFQSLFILKKDFYLSSKMLELYNESNKLKSDFNDESFRIDFKFMIDSDKINYNLLESDGFVLNYIGTT